MTIVDTANGRLRGVLLDGLAVFKGAPYGRPPVGENRFTSSKPVEPWSGTRDASAFGPAPIQTVQGPATWIYPQPERMDEDCLSLNIWAPDRARGNAVIVWIHGGGFRTGAASMPLFDGAELARRGDVVFVSINYRNNVFGWLAHPDLHDDETGACANWGLFDQMLALRWVREHIVSFGGDPDNITVMGQSGGAINAITLAQYSESTALFEKLILLSPPYIAPPSMPSLDDAARFAEDLAREFDTSVSGLRKIPSRALHDAETRQWQSGRVKTQTGRFMRSPVPDGVILESWPPRLPLPNKPTVIGYTRTEGAYWTNLIDPATGRRMVPGAIDEPAVLKAIEGFLGAVYQMEDDRPGADDVIKHYRQHGPQDATPLDTYTEVFGDALLRHYGIRAVERAAGRDAPNLFVYDYALPLAPPGYGTPHCADLPIFFGTFRLNHYRDKTGTGPFHNRLSEAVIEAFSNFARSSEPTARELPSWPVFRPDRSSVMVLGESEVAGQVVEAPKRTQMEILDELALAPDEQ